MKRITITRKEFQESPESWVRMAGPECVVSILDEDGEVKTVMGGRVDYHAQEEREELISQGWIPPDTAKRILNLLHDALRAYNPTTLREGEICEALRLLERPQ